MDKKIVKGICNIKDLLSNWSVKNDANKLECAQFLFLYNTKLNILKYIEDIYFSIGLGYLYFYVDKEIFDFFLLNRHADYDKKNKLIILSDSFLIKECSDLDDIKNVCYISDFTGKIRKIRKEIQMPYDQGDEIYFQIEK